jgi:hypothetical protein
MNRANTGIIGEGGMFLSCRKFLSSTAAAALAGPPAFAAMGPNDKFDLVIKGGGVPFGWPYNSPFAVR